MPGLAYWCTWPSGVNDMPNVHQPGSSMIGPGTSWPLERARTEICA